LAIGLTTRPYPLFRMPGWNRHSVGYHSDDGHKFCDDATGGQPFGPSWTKGDTVGCIYNVETGTVYFSLNGYLIGGGATGTGAFSGLESHVYYPSIGSDGSATVLVNFGAAPFKY
ncbi:concanavalin A-like lectin/glucanase domain-containing protein, partial [Absidia repens]